MLGGLSLTLTMLAASQGPCETGTVGKQTVIAQMSTCPGASNIGSPSCDVVETAEADKGTITVDGGSTVYTATGLSITADMIFYIEEDGIKAETKAW